MVTRLIKIQLITFTILTTITLVALSWYYLRVPALVGVGQYKLYVELPRSGGLYSTANVTYRGITIGRVTSVEPTRRGVRAEMTISDHYRIPADASANVHSVSAIGEQYLDLVANGHSHAYLRNGQTITDSTVPSEVGPALDAANKSLVALPRDKIATLLDETSSAFGGLGPSLRRLVDATTSIAGDLKNNLGPVNDIIANSAPILDSQVSSADAISRWSANLNTLASQSAAQDSALRSALGQAAPTADRLTSVFGDIRDSLPQTLANLEIVLDMLKRYHKGFEQTLVLLPQAAANAQAVVAPYPGRAALDFDLTVNQPPPCLTGYLPASQWRSPADTSTKPQPETLYCKVPQDIPANVVRGARNYPCQDVAGKRAATAAECHSNQPYVPLGTNPWYGDPDQVLNCPAPAARCNQAVKPGFVIPAPSVNNGMNPLPADQLPPGGQTPPPTSDPLQRPGAGSVECNGQQPNPCIYTPFAGPAAIYRPQSGEVTGPDGSQYTVTNSSRADDDGWKQMLSPAR